MANPSNKYQHTQTEYWRSTCIRQKSWIRVRCAKKIIHESVKLPRASFPKRPATLSTYRHRIAIGCQPPTLSSTNVAELLRNWHQIILDYLVFRRWGVYFHMPMCASEWASECVFVCLHEAILHARYKESRTECNKHTRTFLKCFHIVHDKCLCVCVRCACEIITSFAPPPQK